MPPTVAIIMRAKDEMPHVQRSLDMLGRQTFEAFDLFAIDSGSTDGTLQALTTACPHGHVSQIAPGSYIPGKVLNHAIEQTHHDLIVLLNADAVPLSNQWLEHLLQPLLDQHADAVFARQIARPDARFIVSYDYKRAYGTKRMKPDFFSAVACAFKRELWDQHRFRETGYAEDLAWARACHVGGARLACVAEAPVEHSHNYTLKALYRKRLRQAATFGRKPCIVRQSMLCFREILRDTLYACRMLKPHTIPYNIAYRITIHAAMHRGLKEGVR